MNFTAHDHPNHALAATTAAAVVATTFAAQGMVTTATHTLGMPLAEAIAIAGFLELALVASALLARDAVTRGGSGRLDLAATWALSAASGTASAADLLITRPGPAAIVGAAVRIAGPLVACWLWHRIVVGDRDADAPTWTQRLTHRAALAVAVAETAGDDDAARAARIRLARHCPASELPAASDLVATHTATITGATITATAAEPEAPAAPATATEPPAATTPEPTTMPAATTPPPATRGTTKLSAATHHQLLTELLTTNPTATATDYVTHAATHGHTIPETTARRWLDKHRTTHQPHLTLAQ